MNKDFSKSPFILFTIAVVTGIFLGKFLFPLFLSLWLATGLLLLALVIYFIPVNKNFIQLLLLIALLSVSSARFNQVTSILPQNHIVFHEFSQIKELAGVITEKRYKKDNKNKYILSVSSLKASGVNIQAAGKVLVTTNKISQKYEYGDLLRIKGEFKRPKNQRNPGAFDYRSYLAGKDIYATSYIKSIDSISVINKGQGEFFIQYFIEPIKFHCNNVIESFLSEKNSGIMRALLLGEKQDIEKDIVEQFKNVGVVHVLAISGLHVGFIMLFIFAFLSFFRLNYKVKSIALIIFLFIYVVLIDFKAPVVRASLMASLFLLGKVGERKVSVFNIVFAAAFIILLFEPRELFNPGFQFSFTAVISIIYGYKKLDELIPLKRYLFDRFGNKRSLQWLFKYVWIPFLVSLAAVMGTMPLTIYYYGMMPVFALFANIIVIPLIGLIVLLGIFLLILSMFSIFLASGLGNIINNLFQFLKTIISFFNDLPYSYFDMSIPPVIIVLLSLFLVFLVFNLKKTKFHILSVGVIILILILFGYRSNNSENIEITFLDVGQGDACFLQFPNGESMLVDGGDASFGWDHGKNTVVPFLKFKGCSKLKYVVASHPHNDHIGGLIEVLNTISVDTLVLSSYQFNTKIYANLLKVSKNQGVPIRYVKMGDYLYPDSTCRIYVLHPTDEYTIEQKHDGRECNNSSIVLKIQYGENGILLTGDLEYKGEKALLSYAGFLESEILKVGHHGSKTSTSDNLLNQVQPLVGIVSVAERNKFRHPYPGTINRLNQHSVKDFLTSKEGAVVFQVGTKDIKKINWRNNFN